jgi:hypothetical protein
MRVDQGIKARFRVVDFNLLCFIERVAVTAQVARKNIAFPAVKNG